MRIVELLTSAVSTSIMVDMESHEVGLSADQEHGRLINLLDQQFQGKVKIKKFGRTVVIVFINNKGGVGKTTLVQNLIILLAKLGYKVLGVDFEAQHNLSFAITHVPRVDLKTLLLRKKTLTLDDLSPTGFENLYIIPNNKDVRASLFADMPAADQMYAFHDIIKDFKEVDFVVIDTTPALDLPAFNAIMASDYVVVPVEYDVFSANGLVELNENIQSMKRRKEGLDILGIIPNKIDGRYSLNELMKAPLVSAFGDVVFESPMRYNQRFRHAQAFKLDIITYEKMYGLNKSGTKSMIQFAGELLQRVDKLEAKRKYGQ